MMREAPPRRVLRVGQAFCATGPSLPTATMDVDRLGTIGPGEVIEDAGILIVGDRIGAIAPFGQLRIPPQTAVTHLPDVTALPGLIDAHVHLSIRRGETLDLLARDFTDADLLVRSAAHARQILAAGVTTVRDCGSRGNFLHALRDGIATGLLPGPRILTSGPPITTTGGHLWSFGGEVDTAADARALARRLIRDGADFIKVMATGGRMTPGSMPGRAQFDEAELRAIVTDAHRLGRPVAAHVLGTEGMAHAIRAGVDTIEHGNWLDAEGVGVAFDETLVREMATNGQFRNMATNPSRLLAEKPRTAPLDANERRDLGDHQERWYWFRRGLELGVPSFFSTDAVFGQWEASAPDLPWLVILIAERSGIAMPLALRMVTAVAATALGLDDDLGTLAPGRRADLLLVRGDPITTPRDLRSVVAVYRDGVPVA